MENHMFRTRKNRPLAKTKVFILFCALFIVFQIQAEPKVISDSDNFEQLRKSAANGNAETQFKLGRIYDNGEGVEEDNQKAVEWYRRAAEQGDANAQNNLGLMYYNGEGVKEDNQKAVEWYRRAAEQGDANAQYNLGLMYDNGEGVEEDNQKAIEWYRKAAEQGDANAQNNLGFMYFFGEGVQEDDDIAFLWFKKAAKQGEPNSSRMLANYYFGSGVKKSAAKKLESMKRLYSFGNLDAGVDVAMQHLDKKDDFYDPSAAFNILTEMVNIGDGSTDYFSISLALQGHMYTQGIFVDNDDNKALKLFHKADLSKLNYRTFEYLVPSLNKLLPPQLAEKYADQWIVLLDDYCSNKISHNGIIKLQKLSIWEMLQEVKFIDKNLVARCFDKYISSLLEQKYYYDVGQVYMAELPGIKSDPEKAIKYMLMAAESDSSDKASAMNWVGLFYIDGLGVKKDYAKANLWYEKSANLGHAFGHNNLGDQYEYGLGLEVNLSKAFEHYQKAYDLDDECNICMTNLGRMHQFSSAKKDLITAKILYRKAYRLGDIEAGNLLAKLLIDGLAGPKSKERAITILEKVLLGDPEYKFSVGEKAHNEQVEKAREQLVKLGAKVKPDSRLDLGDYYALVIGNSNYKNLANLAAASKDASDIAKVLERDYGFSVKLLLDASRNETIDSLNSLKDQLKENDNFLLYYAGHGIIDETQEGYWQPVDSSEDDAQWISNTRINRTLKKFKANNIILISDSCYAASLMRGLSVVAQEDRDDLSMGGPSSSLIESLNRSKSRVIMTSGGFEAVADRIGFSENSVFAESLIKALKNNAQKITSADIFDKVRERVVPITAEAGVPQTPIFGQLWASGHEGGDFIFQKLEK